jgi:hypothetical protein
MTDEIAIIPIERIDRCIFLIRGQKMMLDFHLAALYGAETKNLNKAVKRNLDRFPADSIFQLSTDEVENLRFQTGTSSLEHGGRPMPLMPLQSRGSPCFPVYCTANVPFTSTSPSAMTPPAMTRQRRRDSSAKDNALVTRPHTITRPDRAEPKRVWRCRVQKGLGGQSPRPMAWGDE